MAIGEELVTIGGGASDHRGGLVTIGGGASDHRGGASDHRGRS